MKRINIFVGNYGCGKTELSVNAALKLREAGDVTLTDMDIVNPYFRSSERKAMLEERGIKVITPQFALTQVDVPSLPAEVFAAFETEGFSVIDCGGDPAGATALGAYREHIERVRHDLAVYFVINARRPLLATAEQVIDMLGVIEHVSGVSVTALINNTNLSFETTPDDLVYGYDVAMEAAQKTGLPLAYTSGTAEALAGFEAARPGHAGEVMAITPYMRPYWL